MSAHCEVQVDSVLSDTVVNRDFPVEAALVNWQEVTIRTKLLMLCV